MVKRTYNFLSPSRKDRKDDFSAFNMLEPITIQNLAFLASLRENKAFFYGTLLISEIIPHTIHPQPLMKNRI